MRIRRILPLLLILALLLPAAVACGGAKDPANGKTEPPVVTTEAPTEPTSEEDTTGGGTPGGSDPNQPIFSGEGKVIDIYLIAGQSNAVGYTKVTDRQAAYDFAPGLQTGYDHVLISGVCRSEGSTSATFTKRVLGLQATTLGLGRINADYFGPEAGMAKAFASHYNAESGRTAVIIKFGHGGTSLLNDTAGNNAFGNWVSPSYAEVLGVPYSGATGGLYREYLNVIRENLTALAERGYTNVNIKGLYWMQGEHDRDRPAQWEAAFQCFLSDLRSDLSRLIKEFTLTADDRGASEMPVFLGTISRSFGSSTASSLNMNASFIATQRSMPTKVEHCYVVDNSTYDITRWNSETNKDIVVGSDSWHWNQADHLRIGENVGNAILRAYDLLPPEPPVMKEAHDDVAADIFPKDGSVKIGEILTRSNRSADVTSSGTPSPSIGAPPASRSTTASRATLPSASRIRARTWRSKW